MKKENRKLQWFTSISFLLLLCCALVSFKSYMPGTALWDQLGIDQTKADQKISIGILNGYLDYYGVKNLKNIATGNRASIVKDLCEYTKVKVNSNEFKNEYTALREQKKPVQPSAPRSDEEIRASYLNSLRDGIKNSEEAAKSLTGDLQKSILENITTLKQQLKEAEQPGNEMVGMMIDGEKFSYHASMIEYERKLKEWEENYPANHLQFVKKRLQQFMEITKDVDFNAELVTRNGKKYFASSFYEQQPGQWKQAFRAGKEATQTARLFAAEWIKEIN